MGRKTYESLGRLLPGRTTIIVTRNKHYKVEGALIAHSLQAAWILASGDAEPFVIGGAELYQEGLKLATKLYITEVKAEFEGDAFFPAIDENEWKLVEKKDHVAASGLEYSDLIYIRNKESIKFDGSASPWILPCRHVLFRYAIHKIDRLCHPQFLSPNRDYRFQNLEISR